jgi:hypothetical protein
MRGFQTKAPRFQGRKEPFDFPPFGVLRYRINGIGAFA